MTQILKGAAKRLIFSLVTLSALGGCAVYGPPNPGPYAYGTGGNGGAVYVAPPVYAAQPYYYNPLFVGPPVSLNFGFWGGGGGWGRDTAAHRLTLQRSGRG